MAITIQTEPALIGSASNPLEFTFSSDQTSQPNYSFVIELTVNGSIHSYHESFPESGNFGKFDASKVLRSTVFSNLLPDGTMLVPSSNYTATYAIKVYDKYGATPTTIGSGTATSTTVNAFNAALRYDDFVNFDFTDYDVDDANNKLFLTNFPRAQSYFCGINESIFLAMLNSGSAVDVYVDLYDVSDVLIVSDNTAIATTDTLVISDVSPQTIIATMAITVGNFTSAFYYKVYFRSTSFTSEQFTIYIDRECTKFTTRRLHWLNKFGVWDSYTFNKFSEEGATVQTTNFEKGLGEWNSSNGREFNLQSGQSLTNVKITKDTLQLNSDWIKQAKHNWLVRSLYDSPKVYLEVSQGVFEYVNILASSYTLKQKSKEGLLNEQVDIQRTYIHRSQLG